MGEEEGREKVGTGKHRDAVGGGKEGRTVILIRVRGCVCR